MTNVEEDIQGRTSTYLNEVIYSFKWYDMA